MTHPPDNNFLIMAYKRRNTLVELTDGIWMHLDEQKILTSRCLEILD